MQQDYLKKNISQLDLNIDINKFIGFNNIRQNKKISYEDQIKVMKGYLSEFDKKQLNLNKIDYLVFMMTLDLFIVLNMIKIKIIIT